MVHVAQPDYDLGSSLGTLLGQGVGQYFGAQQQQQQQEQQQSKLRQSLQEAEQMWADPNLSPEQKQIGLYRVLSANPEIAQQLSPQLGQIGVRQQQAQQQKQQSAEELRQQEQQSAEELQRNKQLLSGLEQQRGLPEGSLNSFVSNPAMAELITRKQGDKDATASTAPLIAGLQTIAEMRKIGAKGNIGRGSAIWGAFGGETAKDRAQYEQLGKSLITLSSSIPIRNRQEFDVLSKNLYDPGLLDSEREGILNAMENIIMRNLQQYLPEKQEEQKKETSEPKQRPPLTSFHK